MKRSLSTPFVITSALFLWGCGARSALTEPDPCGAWAVRDGAPGAVSGTGKLAALDDGGVVVPMALAINTDARSHSLRKINRKGETVWDADPGPNIFTIRGMTQDAAGRLVVVGSMLPGTLSVQDETLDCLSENGTCTFFGGVGEDGGLSWGKVFSSHVAVPFSIVAPVDFAVTGDGRITVLGWFAGTMDFGCGPLITPNDKWSLFLAQHSPAGECLWSRAIVGSPLFAPTTDNKSLNYSNIAVDDAGEVALSIRRPQMVEIQTIDLGGGPVAFDTTKGGAFAVAKYAPNGDLVFSKVVTGGNTTSTRVQVGMTTAGEVILATAHDGFVDLGGGPRGLPGFFRSFVTKLGAQGEELWTRDVAISLSEVQLALAVEAGGGFTLATPSVPEATLLDPPELEAALSVATYDAAGELIKMRTFESSGSANVFGLGASPDGALVLSGQFDGTLDFGRDLLEAEGVKDAYVARICR